MVERLEKLCKEAIKPDGFIKQNLREIVPYEACKNSCPAYLAFGNGHYCFYKKIYGAK